MSVLVSKTVKLKDLKVLTVVPDDDGEIDCVECGDPVGYFEEVFVSNEDEQYLICSRCGAIYKVKD